MVQYTVISISNDYYKYYLNVYLLFMNLCLLYRSLFCYFTNSLTFFTHINYILHRISLINILQLIILYLCKQHKTLSICLHVYILLLYCACTCKIYLLRPVSAAVIVLWWSILQLYMSTLRCVWWSLISCIMQPKMECWLFTGTHLFSF